MTVVIAALAACGVFLIAWLLADALRFPLPERDACYVVHLHGSTAQTEQTIKSCLRLRECGGLRGKLIFVDGGLDTESQMAAELLLRRKPAAVLCAPSQITEMIHWENDEIGAGAD